MRRRARIPPVTWRSMPPWKVDADEASNPIRPPGHDDEAARMLVLSSSDANLQRGWLWRGLWKTVVGCSAGPSSPPAQTNVATMDWLGSEQLSKVGSSSLAASLAAQPSLSTNAVGAAMDFSQSSCRPWERGDLLHRLATFKPSTWASKPKSQMLEKPLPNSLMHRTRMIVPWRGNSCADSLVQLHFTPSALLGGFKDRCEGLLQFISLPVIASSAIESMKLTRNHQICMYYPINCDSVWGVGLQNRRYSRN
ncbi:hypothetical protein ACQ4PT_058900 [Festuca glaucescens]